MSAELFYSHIVNINRGSTHTKSFRRVSLFVFKYLLTKNGFATQKVSGPLEKRVPGLNIQLRKAV